MSTPKVKKTSTWPNLERALVSMAEGGIPSSAVYTAIADRLRIAIETTDSSKVQAASDILEAAFQTALTASPASVQAVSRGEDGSDLSMSYALGKLAFAQLLAGRIADTRADDRFVEHVRNRHYLPYLQALFETPLTVNALQAKIGSRLETVSRKLAVLRALGLVASRRQGTEVVNMLTPAATVTLEALGLNPVTEAIPVVRAPNVREALDEERGALQPHMQAVPAFKGRWDVPRHKVA